MSKEQKPTPYKVGIQADIIRKAQQEGRLKERIGKFYSLTRLKKDGKTWFCLQVKIDGDHYITVPSEHCDGLFPARLTPGDEIIEIFENQERPDEFGEQSNIAVAAIYQGKRLLYQSPGFDPKAF